MGIGKTFFLSYAQADAPLPTRLLDLLQPRLAIMKGVDCDAGLDTMIPVGTDWRREIDQALDRCDFGLLLLSPGFFAGRFIFGQELPRLLGLGPDGGISIRKPIVPVGIEAVSLDGSADLKGLDRTQIFHDSQARWFNRTRGHISETFADELVAAISAKLRADP